MKEEFFNKKEQLGIPEREKLEEEKKFILIVNSESLASEKHSEINQDAFLVDKENEIFGVFDGLGGEAAGEVASKMAKDLIEEKAKIIAEALTSNEVKDYLREFLEIASKKITEDGYEYFERMGMGTTASLVKICRFKNELPQAVIANVGDSRVYLKKETGEFRQITKDDSVVQELLDKKLINEKEALIHPQRNIVTEILGGIDYRKPKISITTIEINPGDKILICTDGIHDNLTNEEIEKIFNKKNIIGDNLARELVFQARNIAKQGKRENPKAKMDDMTAIVVEVVKCD